MLTPPTDLDPAALAAALAHWGLGDARLEYLPVGFGSHHWRAGDAFVTVDDLATKTFEDLIRRIGPRAPCERPGSSSCSRRYPTTQVRRPAGWASTSRSA